jgi:hypothetical protein
MGELLSGDTRYRTSFYGRNTPFFQQNLATFAHFSEAWARLAEQTAKTIYTVQIAITPRTIKVIIHDCPIMPISRMGRVNR